MHALQPLMGSHIVRTVVPYYSAAGVSHCSCKFRLSASLALHLHTLQVFTGGGDLPANLWTEDVNPIDDKYGFEPVLYNMLEDNKKVVRGF